MVLLLGILTIVFLLIAFTSSVPVPAINPLFDYGISQFQFFSQYPILFYLGLIIVTAIFYKLMQTPSGYPKMKKLLVALAHGLAGIFISWFAAFALLLCVAYLELTIYAIVININPALTGVTTDKKAIVKALASTSKYPEIITSNTDQQKMLAAIAVATAGKTSLYGGSILPAIPTDVVWPVSRPASSILLIDNTLIITAINPQDLNMVSPYIGYLFVKNYFFDRHIKSYPKIGVVGKADYAAFRKADIVSKLQQINKELVLIQDAASTGSATIANDKDTITYTKTHMQDLYDERDKEYRTCLKTGTKASCQSVMDTWETTIQKADQSITNANQKLTTDQNQQAIYAYFANLLARQKAIVATSAENIPHELGVFTPKDTIKIMIFTTNPHALADYLETLTHEYLHYASYVSDQKRLTSSFFEEGLTEYFARKTIQQTLDTSTNLGYPLYTKIIDQISKRISDPDLADIYFSKDQTLLETELNRVYGDNFYATTRVLFDTLQYTSNPKDVLKIANEIMKRIGGKPLTEKDLMSSSSNLN